MDEANHKPWKKLQIAHSILAGCCMEPFKNLISEEIVTLCAMHLGKHLPEFDEFAFTSSILPTLSQLELKQRVKLI